MSTQKRRIVYFTDEEWDSAKRRAATLGVSVSAFIRDAMRWEPPSQRTVHIGHLPQAERDAILRRIEKGNR